MLVPNSAPHPWINLEEKMTDRARSGISAVAAMLTELKQSRTAVVELPIPDDVGSGQDGEFDAWWGHYPNNDASHPSKWPNWDVTAERGDVHLGALQMRPEKARAMALALLAAADVAEAHHE